MEVSIFLNEPSDSRAATRLYSLVDWMLLQSKKKQYSAPGSTTPSDSLCCTILGKPGSPLHASVP